MKRDTRTAYRARAKATEATVDAAVAAVKAEQDAEWTARREAARKAEAARVRFTRDDIEGAIEVRTLAHGWQRVVRVNKTSVTVETGHSWTDRHPFHKVLEVRTVNA